MMEFKDRRKEKAEAESTAVLEPAAEGTQNVVEFKTQAKGEVLDFKSIGYVIAMLPVGQATVMVLRAVGLRTDEKMFTADYAIPGMLEEHENFVAEAKKRLMTFKACSCDQRGRCVFHGEKLPGPAGMGEWLKSDVERLNRIQNKPMPEAVEILMKAEQARAQQPKILVPGRG